MHEHQGVDETLRFARCGACGWTEGLLPRGPFPSEDRASSSDPHQSTQKQAVEDPTPCNHPTKQTSDEQSSGVIGQQLAEPNIPGRLDEIRAPVQAGTVNDQMTVASSKGVFKPLKKIQWPSRCVGCYSSAATASLNLNVFPVTKLASGSKVGGLVGGLAGMAVSATLGEVGGFEVPICKNCLGQMSSSELDGLAKHDLSIIAPKSYHVETGVLDLDLTMWCVLVTFKNGQYSSAFRQLNAGLAFDTIKECTLGRAAK